MIGLRQVTFEGKVYFLLTHFWNPSLLFHSFQFTSSIHSLHLCSYSLLLATQFKMAAPNGSTGNDFTVKAGLAQMLKGGVIMDVVNAEQV